MRRRLEGIAHAAGADFKTLDIQVLGIVWKCNRRIKPLMRRVYLSTDEYRKYSSTRNLTCHHRANPQARPQ